MYYDSSYSLSRLPQNTLLYPSYVAGSSVLLLLGQTILYSCRTREPNSETIGGFATRLRKDISNSGGLVILALKLLRLVACLSIVGLSLASLRNATSISQHDISILASPQAALCATFVCPSF